MQRLIHLWSPRVGSALTSKKLFIFLSLMLLVAACDPASSQKDSAVSSEGNVKAQVSNDAVSSADTTSGFSTNPYCGTGILCSALPGDEISVPPGCESYDQQCSRDFWSWQNFVALNYPGQVNPDKSVSAKTGTTPSDSGDRLWELWMDPNAVFLPNAVTPAWAPGDYISGQCSSGEGKQILARSSKASVAFDLEPDSFFEATVVQPLIDQANNYVVFEIRMNKPEVDWVVQNKLYDKSVVDAWPKAKQLKMPSEAIEIKAAWRIIPDDMSAAEQARYYTRPANIVLSADHVENPGSGKEVCLEKTLGLIGLHIRHNGLWSTFEQIDNVTRNDGFGPTLNNPDCATCAVNVPPANQSGPLAPSDYKWSTTGATASPMEGNKNVPSQVQRVKHQYMNPAMNIWWQTHVLAGTPFQYYELITTNWLEFPTSAQPVPTLNTSMEPYIPTDTSVPQDCIDCHMFAKNKNGAEMARTFLVFRACSKSGSADLDAAYLPPNCGGNSLDIFAIPGGEK